MRGTPIYLFILFCNGPINKYIHILFVIQIYCHYSIMGNCISRPRRIQHEQITTIYLPQGVMIRSVSMPVMHAPMPSDVIPAQGVIAMPSAIRSQSAPPIMRGAHSIPAERQKKRRDAMQSEEKSMFWAFIGGFILIIDGVNVCFFPRKIQSLTFPLIKAGHDLKGHAKTGSGKSAAFLLPIIDAVMKLKKAEVYSSRRCCPFALIVEPTRELTGQLYDQARKLAADCDVSVSRAYGMFLRNVNLRQISTDGCDILIGTPGRLCDFFQAKNIVCDNLKVLVFDEADQLLEDGFQAVLRQLNNVTNWPKVDGRQTLLFSATFPMVVQNWAEEWMRKDSMMVSNRRLVAANTRIRQKFLLVNSAAKKDILLRLFQLELTTAKKRDPVDGRIRNTMVFVNTKRDADVVSTYLNQFGFNTTTINGNRPQEMRDKALSDFRAGVYQVVVTTDVCARGHDLKDLDHVINMDLPASGEGIDDSYTIYVHRIGRTGRLQQGAATTFFDCDTDMTMASMFVQGLKEANQPVSEWLKQLADGKCAAGTGDVTDEELLGVM